MVAQALTSVVEGSTIEFDVDFHDADDSVMTPSTCDFTTYRNGVEQQASTGATIIGDTARCRVLASNVRVASGNASSDYRIEVVTTFPDGRILQSIYYVRVLAAVSVV